MKKIVLKTLDKTPGEKGKHTLASGFVPGVVYGKGQETLSFKVKNTDILRAYRSAGETRILTLEVAGNKIDVLFHQIQKQPVSGEIMHVDFYAITKGEALITHIPLIFTGVSKAKTDEAAIIEEVLKHVEVKCLPQDLVDSFEVDLSKLEKTGDNIKVEGIGISDKYEILTPLDEVVVLASKSREEVVDTAAPELDLPAEESEDETGDEE